MKKTKVLPALALATGLLITGLECSSESRSRNTAIKQSIDRCEAENCDAATTMQHFGITSNTYYSAIEKSRKMHKHPRARKSDRRLARMVTEKQIDDMHKSYEICPNEIATR